MNTGWTFSHVLKFSRNRGYLDRDSYIIQYLASSVFITGIANVIGIDDLLAAFVAGKPLVNV